MGFESWITQYLQSILRNGMTFLDIGAANGYYTLLASPLVKEVVAIEPKPDERGVLLENIGKNGLKNVTVLTQPLFSKVTRGSMRKCRFRPMPGGDYMTVTLDSLGLDPDVVKIDVEGAELDVLRGGVETLYRCKPIVVVEIHKHKIETFGHHWTAVYDFFTDLGCEINDMGSRRRVCFIGACFEEVS